MKAKLPPFRFRWYGFDLDGTIADNSLHTFGFGTIGKPIKPMCNQMKRLHRQGYDVRIFTARLSDVGKTRRQQARIKDHIWQWCDINLGFRPPIVDRKDASMEALYDDRAKQVVRNKGLCYENINKELADCLLLALQKKSVSKDKELFLRCKRALKKMGYNA